MNFDNNMPTRQIVNSNINVTNVTGDIKAILSSTLTQIIKILKDHCGPYADYAVIVDASNPIAEPIFTKDGINIVRALEYVSPMQEFVKRQLAYIGSRVDAAGSDGTTTSMLIAALALSELLTTKIVGSSTTELEQAFSALYKPLASFYDCNYEYSGVYTKEKLMEHSGKTKEEAIRFIANAQLMTSSHGDKELANIVSKMFSTLPEFAWDTITLQSAKFETDNKYAIEYDHTQYRIDYCKIHPLKQMTEDFGTKCIREDIPTILSLRVPSVGDPDTTSMLAAIEAAIVAETPLMVICPDQIDNATYCWLEERFNKHPNHKTLLILVPETQFGIPNEIMFIKALASEVVGPFTDCTLSIVFEGSKLNINAGLYPKVTTDECIKHPYLNDATKPNYNKLVEFLTEHLEYQRIEKPNKQSAEVLNLLSTLYNKFTMVNRSTFILGGSAYDNAAAIDVIRDSIPAAKRALTTGFVLGGNRSLLKRLNTILLLIGNGGAEINKLRNTYIHTLIKAIKTTIRYTIENSKISVTTCEHKVSCIEDYICDIKLVVDDDAILPKIESMDVYDLFDNYQELQVLPIIQPATVDLELIKRFGEVAIKFIKAARMITTGGIVVNKEIAE